jgi:eukaryotic-like serine/threonine-protein kinase
MASQAHPSAVIRFGPFELDGVSGELRKAGISLKIQPQPFRVLQLLAERPGQIVTREEIQHCLWGDNTFVDYERGINFCVNQIRAALGDHAEKPRYIETLPRRGYRFVVTPTIGAPTELKFVPGRSAVLPVGAYSRPGDGEAAGSSISFEDAAIPTTSIPISPRKWGRVAVVILAAFVAAGGSGVAVFRWTSHERGSNFENLRFTKLTNSGKAEDVAISPDGTYVVYPQRDRNGVGLWVRHVASGSEVQILPSEEVDFRGLTVSRDGNSVYFVRTRKESGSFKDLYAIPVLGGPVRLLAKDIDSPVSFSPDGRRFVYTTGMPQDANEVHIANADGNENRVSAIISGTSDNFQAGAAWSPDGRTIAVSLMLHGERTGFVLDSISVLDGTVHEILRQDQVIGRPLWLPGGNTILLEVDNSKRLGQLWTVSFPTGETRRVTNDLANWGIRIDATRDARTLAGIQWTLVADLWSASSANLSNARRITHGGIPMVAALSAPHQKILAVSADDEPWIMSAEGAGVAPFSSLHEVANPVICGNFMVAASYPSGPGETVQARAHGEKPRKLASGRLIWEASYQFGPADIVRVDADGLNPTKLASGLVYSPTCSPDGKFVFYVLMTHPQKILRVPIQGGDPIEIGTIPGPTVRGTMRMSPDGKFLAFPFDQYVPKPAIKLAVVPVKQGPAVRIFDAPAGIYRESCLRWSPDGKGLQYLLTVGDVTNIWEQRLTGGGPRQVTTFTSGRIFDFNWTADGKKLLLSRGEVKSDVVLLSNLR